MSPPILHGPTYSVYVCAARLALAEKGVCCELNAFDVDAMPAERRALHPFSRVPVLTHGKTVIYETNAILRYIDEAFDGPQLQPTDALLRARMNQAIGIIDAYGYEPMVRVVFVQRVRWPPRGLVADEVAVAAAAAIADRSFDALERLQGNASFLAGETISLADIHVFPHLITYAETPEGKEAFARHPDLRAWLGRFRQRSSVACIADFFC